MKWTILAAIAVGFIKWEPIVEAVSLPTTHVQCLFLSCLLVVSGSELLEYLWTFSAPNAFPCNILKP